MVQVSCLYAFELSLHAGHSCPAHQHGCTEIVWCDNCTGDLFQNQTRSHFDGQSIFIYQPGNDHWIQCQNGGRQICIGVQGAHAELIPAAVHQRNAQIDHLFSQIEQALHKQDRIRLDCYAGLVVQEFLPHKPALNASPVEQAKAFIDNHIGEQLSVESIANTVFVSPDYLRQLFKKAYGHSIMHYVIEQRLDLAQRMLSDSNQSIQDIAEQCGFQSPYYFSRLFKKYRSLSPSAYRKQHQS